MQGSTGVARGHGESQIGEIRKGRKLLDRALDALRASGIDATTADQYVSSMREYILFHGKRHPQEMGALEVEQSK